MYFFKTIFTTLVLSGLSFNAVAEGKVQVIDNGQDGDKRYYGVTCPDGSRAGVTAEFILPEVDADPETRRKKNPNLSTTASAKKVKLKQICMYSNSGKEECKPKWSIDAAAEASCQ